MYATKLMMNQGKSYNYVEDDSLLRKVENKAFGSYIDIPNVRSGVNSFTYCGTLPTSENGVFLKGINMLDIWRYSFALYAMGDGRIIMRNLSNGAGITPTSPIDYKGCVATDVDVQPYVAFTLYFPTETSQYMTLRCENDEKAIFEGNWAHRNYDYVYTNVADGSKVIDLGLVYNRVLTDEELEQNYKAFLQRYR